LATVDSFLGVFSHFVIKKENMNDFLPVAVAEETRQSAIAEELQRFLERSQTLVKTMERAGYTIGPVVVIGAVDHLVAGPTASASFHAPSRALLDQLFSHPSTQSLLSAFNERGEHPVAMIYFDGGQIPERESLRVVGYFPDGQQPLLERTLSPQQDRELRDMLKEDQRQDMEQTRHLLETREASQEQGLSSWG